MPKNTTSELHRNQPDPQGQAERASVHNENDSPGKREAGGQGIGSPASPPPTPAPDGDGQSNGTRVAAPPARARLRYRLLGRAGSVAVAICVDDYAVAVVKGDILSSAGRKRLEEDIIGELSGNLVCLNTGAWLHHVACTVFDTKAVGKEEAA